MIWGGALKACWYRENAKFDTWGLSMWRTPRKAHPVEAGNSCRLLGVVKDILWLPPRGPVTCSGRTWTGAETVMLCSWNERLTCFLHHWRSQSSEQCLGCRHFWIPQTCSRYSTHKYLVNGLWVNKCTEHWRVKSTQWEEGRGQEEQGDWLGNGVRTALQDVENCPRHSNVSQREVATRTLNGPLGLTIEHQIMCLLQGSLERIPGIWECSLWWVGSQSVWGKCLKTHSFATHLAV